MSDKTKPAGKVMPTNFQRGRKYEQTAMWNRASGLGFWTRLKIFLGYNVIIHVKAISQHSPGEVAMGIFPQATKHTTESLKQNPSLEKIAGENPENTKVVDGVEFQKAVDPKE